MIDRREPITKEWVRDKLIGKHTMELRILLLIGVPGVVFFSGVTALLVGERGWWVFLCMEVIFLLGCILQSIHILKKRSMARAMQFLLVPDKVIDLVSEDRYL